MSDKTDQNLQSIDFQPLVYSHERQWLNICSSTRNITITAMNRWILFLITSIMGLSVHAQEAPIKAVVLINGAAHLVDVSRDGNISNVYQRIDNYFTTKEGHASIVKRLSKDAQPDGSQIAFFNKEEEPLPSFTEENKLPVKIDGQQYIGFSPGRALLQKAGVDQIRKIAKGYRNGGISAIRIDSYYEDNYRSKSLARNRAQAIKDLLQAFGMPEVNIATSTAQGSIEVKVDFVQLSFL